MDELLKKIDEERNVKQGTMKVYRTNLTKTHEAMTDNAKKFDKDFLDDKDKVLKFISKFSRPTQRTYVSSFVVASDTMGKDELAKEYRKELSDIRTELEKKIVNGEKSEKQEKNWTGIEPLRKVMKSMRKDLEEDNVFEKKELTRRNKKELQDWVITNLYLGDDDNPPSRNDYAPMKIISKDEYKELAEEKENHNYLVIDKNNRKFFSFNDYKTADRYGTKHIRVGRKLNKVLNIWLSHNEGDYLLYNEKGDPMTSQQLSKRISTIFKRTGKNITTNLIRSMYISERFPRNESDERKEVADKMGHSVDTQMNIYAKK